MRPKQLRSGMIAGLALAAVAGPAIAADAPKSILFVGNSFTHGKYSPVINYNSGYDANANGNSTDTSHVHDLLCLTAATCTSSEKVTATNPDSVTGTSVADKLNNLNTTQGALKTTEPGPFGGIPGIFLQFTKDLGLNYNVSIIAVSSATLNGASYYNNGTATNSATNYLNKIATSAWDQVVLQEQSFSPLPSTVAVNGQPVTTRGNFTAFEKGVNGIVTKIDAADTTAGKAKIPVTLYETQPLASYSYLSTNPNAPIYGSSSGIQGGNNNQPYVGLADPVVQMAGDLHAAYTKAATDATALGGSTVSASLAGDAWITAMNNGLAMKNPYLANEPAGLIDLWDSDPLAACCTTPIGYHPSVYGSFLNALVLFETITGEDARLLGYDKAARDLNISSDVALGLEYAASLTVAANGPTVPEPASFALLGGGLAGIGALRLRRRG